MKNFDGTVETILMIPNNPGLGWILEMTLLGGHWEAAGTLWRGPEGTGEVENENKSNHFDRPVDTIQMIPHNPGFGWILEMTLSEGRLEATGTLQRGPGGTGGVENENK